MAGVLRGVAGARGVLDPAICQWIEGEPKADGPRCGRPSCAEHRSWCSAHYRRVFVPGTGGLNSALWTGEAAPWREADPDERRLLGRVSAGHSLLILEPAGE